MAERIRGHLHMQHAKPVEIENLNVFIAWLSATSKNDKYDSLTAPSPPEEIFMPNYGLEGEIGNSESANVVLPREEVPAYAAWKNGQPRGGDKSREQYRSTESLTRLESVLPYQPGDKRNKYAPGARQQERWDYDRTRDRRPMPDANPVAMPVDDKRIMLRAMMKARAASRKCKDAKNFEECQRFAAEANEALHKCLQLGSGKYQTHLAVAVNSAELLADAYGTEQAEAHFNAMELYLQQAVEGIEALDEKPEGVELATLADTISDLNADQTHVALKRARKSFQVLSHDQKQTLLLEPDFQN